MNAAALALRKTALLDEVNDAHEALMLRVCGVVRDARGCFEEAADIGKKLMQGCELNGSFDKWRRNDPRPLVFSRSTAYNYMRIAKLRPEELASASGYRMLGLLPPPSDDGSTGGNGATPTPFARAIDYIGKGRELLEAAAETWTAIEARRFLDETEQIVNLRIRARKVIGGGAV